MQHKQIVSSQCPRFSMFGHVFAGSTRQSTEGLFVIRWSPQIKSLLLCYGRGVQSDGTWTEKKKTKHCRK